MQVNKGGRGDKEQTGLYKKIKARTQFALSSMKQLLFQPYLIFWVSTLNTQVYSDINPMFPIFHFERKGGKSKGITFMKIIATITNSIFYSIYFNTFQHTLTAGILLVAWVLPKQPLTESASPVEIGEVCTVYKRFAGTSCLDSLEQSSSNPCWRPYICGGQSPLNPPISPSFDIKEA